MLPCAIAGANMVPFPIISPPHYFCICPTAPPLFPQPAERLVVVVAGSGPTGVPLELRHSQRSTLAVMDEVKGRRTNAYMPLETLSLPLSLVLAAFVRDRHATNRPTLGQLGQSLALSDHQSHEQPLHVRQSQEWGRNGLQLWRASRAGQPSNWAGWVDKRGLCSLARKWGGEEGVRLEPQQGEGSGRQGWRKAENLVLSLISAKTLYISGI